MNEPTHLDLFSGIGGFALAARQAGFRTIGFCEIDPYCQKVLAKNFLADADCKRHKQPRSAGISSPKETQTGWSNNIAGRSRCVIYSDIFDFDATAYRGVDLITGGFPCQPFSVAGKRGGAADDRHLWPEMLRVIKEARPDWVLGENVPGIIPMELDNVLSDLEAIGYATRPFIIPACAVDARHRRERLWIVAYSERDLDKRTGRGGNGISGAMAKLDRQEHSASGEPSGAGEQVWRYTEQRHANVPDDAGERSQGEPKEGRQRSDQHGGAFLSLRNGGDRTKWLPEPDVGRVAHGVPSRMDRLKGLGNSIVPQVAFEILKEIGKVFL